MSSWEVEAQSCRWAICVNAAVRVGGRAAAEPVSVHSDGRQERLQGRWETWQAP